MTTTNSKIQIDPLNQIPEQNPLERISNLLTTSKQISNNISISFRCYIFLLKYCVCSSIPCLVRDRCINKALRSLWTSVPYRRPFRHRSLPVHCLIDDPSSLRKNVTPFRQWCQHAAYCRFNYVVVLQRRLPTNCFPLKASLGYLLVHLLHTPRQPTETFWDVANDDQQNAQDCAHEDSPRSVDSYRRTDDSVVHESSSLDVGRRSKPFRC